jgi:acetyl-CoA acetyltransferase
MGHVVFGNVIATEPKDMYMARVAAINGGVSEAAPALTVNRLCGSGLQAIISAAQAILLGDADVAIGGGAENMSRAPYMTPDGFVNLSRLRRKDGRKEHHSESVGRISGDFGDFAPRNESRRELFAIE